MFAVYGMYVIDECNIETHGMQPYVGRLADDPHWAGAYMQRLSRMVERDCLHTCIIGWSLGNEAGYGLVHDRMAQWLRQRDNTRIIMYEPASYGPRGDNDLTTTSIAALKTSEVTKNTAEMDGIDVPKEETVATDVLCPMYAKVEECIRLSTRFPTMPLIQCEYAHMMGKRTTCFIFLFVYYLMTMLHSP